MSADYDYGMSIFPAHARMLGASGITPEHARARGYLSVDTKRLLLDKKVTPAGCSVPGLLVPQRGADGSVWGYQYRPDNPRVLAGKPVKYETPFRQRNGIDFPPGVGPLLGDQSVPLWITEGVKKADAAVLAGLACVALPGVWSWRGSNPRGGKVAVPDWHDIALNDRRVVLAFDSDVTTKPAVRKALSELAGYLAVKGAKVAYCHLPDDDPGKTGLDDYLVAGHTAADLLALVRPDMPDIRAAESVSAATESGPAGDRSPTGAPLPPVAPDPPVTPGPPVDGAEMLAELAGHFREYIVTVTDADHDLLALWTVHTHLVVECYTSPRLQIDSPMPGSGKTTVLEHLQRLACRPIQMASLSSPALLTRMLDKEMRTILIDEADRSLNPDKDGVADLFAVINSGYKRGATRPVLVPVKGGGWDVSEMPTYAPVALAGNNPNLPDDTRTRIIRVLLLPDMDGRATESDWEQIEDDALALAERIGRWADQVRDAVRACRPVLPEGITGRFREKWGPLRRIAEIAGGRWPAAVDAMALQDREQFEMDKEDGLIKERPAILLLKHLFEVWPEGESFWSTADIITALVLKHPPVWGDAGPFGKELTAHRLGRMLAQSYKINSTRIAKSGPRGYAMASLSAVWRQMRIDPTYEPVEAAQPAQPATIAPLAPLPPDSPVYMEVLPNLATVESECRVCGRLADPDNLAGLCGADDHDHRVGWTTAQTGLPWPGNAI